MTMEVSPFGAVLIAVLAAPWIVLFALLWLNEARSRAQKADAARRPAELERASERVAMVRGEDRISLADLRQRFAGARAKERAILRATVVMSLEGLQVLSGSEFEADVQAVLIAANYGALNRVGGPHDRGIDLLGEDAIGRLVAVQCKQYGSGRKVSSSEMQLFVGMATADRQADRRVYVTTSSFSRDAVALAAKHQVELIDGHGLVRLKERVVSARAYASIQMAQFRGWEASTDIQNAVNVLRYTMIRSGGVRDAPAHVPYDEWKTAWLLAGGPMPDGTHEAIRVVIQECSDLSEVRSCLRTAGLSAILDGSALLRNYDGSHQTLDSSLLYSASILGCDEGKWSSSVLSCLGRQRGE